MTDTTQRTMHAISSGSYSDYSVDLIVDGDRATAQAVADKMNAIGRSSYDDYKVEEITVIRSVDDIHAITWWEFALEYRRGVVTSREWSYVATEFGDAPDASAIVTEGGLWCGGHAVKARSTDRERAVKVASDRMAQWRSEQNEPEAE